MSGLSIVLSLVCLQKRRAAVVLTTENRTSSARLGSVRATPAPRARASKVALTPDNVFWCLVLVNVLLQAPTYLPLLFHLHVFSHNFVIKNVAKINHEGCSIIC